MILKRYTETRTNAIKSISDEKLQSAMNRDRNQVVIGNERKSTKVRLRNEEMPFIPGKPQPWYHGVSEIACGCVENKFTARLTIMIYIPA